MRPRTSPVWLVRLVAAVMPVVLTGLLALPAVAQVAPAPSARTQAAPAGESAPAPKKAPPRRPTFFERFPEADANGDGVLTAEETQAYAAKLRREQPTVQRGTGKVDLPEGARHLVKQMVPMRDGTGIATDILLPAGEGPWPVVLFRTPYGRLASLPNNGVGFVEQGVAWVAQDFRGLYDSEGSFDSFTHEMDDGHDALDWIAAQPWCNGRIGMTGGSGPGIGAKLAMVSNHPNLVAVAVAVAASNLHQYGMYHGGVLRAQMNDTWFAARGEEIHAWPKPRTATFTDVDRARMLCGDGRPVTAALLDAGGWYDIFLQSALDDFVALEGNPNRRVIIGGTGHGKIEGLTYPANSRMAVNSTAWLIHWLKETKNNPAAGPPVLYYLMGDTVNAGAPGNVWKQSDTWPVPHEATSYFMTADGGLERESTSQAGSRTYAYDPRDPVPTIGGANLTIQKGPMDQRPLAGRDDILRFRTEPLAEPLEVTGKVVVELEISTDVPDTTFMAKLVDVYPDGYEALVLDSAIMARYWNGFDDPAPLEPGKIYMLTVDLWSTALIFDAGHRIAVHLASSNAPRYDVHPNSYEPVNSFDDAPVAHQTIHTGGEHPSRLILPVVVPGVSVDYRPAGN